MRGRLSLICAGLLLAAGCDRQASAGPPTVDPNPVVVALPAASAGGACRLLDYAVVAKRTGLAFDVSAASRNGSTRSCLLRSEEQARPDLSLSFSPTRADPAVFRSETVPHGAHRVTGLGRAAYRSTKAATASRGAVVEVGWLTRDGRIMTVRCTLAVTQDTVELDTLATGLVDLARELDARDVPADAGVGGSDEG